MNLIARPSQRPHAFARPAGAPARPELRRPGEAAAARVRPAPLPALDPEAFTLAEVSLWQTLERQLCQGGEWLDLRAHGAALQPASDELMEAFADACRRQRLRVRVLSLPDGLVREPGWLGAFPGVRVIAGPTNEAMGTPSAVPLALAA